MVLGVLFGCPFHHLPMSASRLARERSSRFLPVFLILNPSPRLVEAGFPFVLVIYFGTLISPLQGS